VTPEWVLASIGNRLQRQYEGFSSIQSLAPIYFASASFHSSLSSFSTPPSAQRFSSSQSSSCDSLLIIRVLVRQIFVIRTSYEAQGKLPTNLSVDTVVSNSLPLTVKTHFLTKLCQSNHTNPSISRLLSSLQPQQAHQAHQHLHHILSITLLSQ
jgi:hypothetical protein